MTIRRARQFKTFAAAAAEIIAGNDTFFDDTEKASRWFAVTAKFRNSPRPIYGDAQGRLFEANTGERYVAPGTTPENVLKALSPVDETQTRSLDEVIASRAKNGL